METEEEKAHREWEESLEEAVHRDLEEEGLVNDMELSDEDFSQIEVERIEYYKTRMN